VISVKTYPGKSGLVKRFRLVAVAPHAGHERQVMGESFDGEQTGEFLLAPGFGVTGEPARFGKLAAIQPWQSEEK